MGCSQCKVRASDKSEVSLENYRGKNVVLLFFPLAFTGVCTDELCTMRDDIGTYEGLDAQILAVSVDSLFTLEKFKAEQNYNFPLLSDFNKNVSRAYGALYEDFVLDMKGVSKRSAFVIDKNGVIQYAEVLESAGDLPNFSAVKETLGQLS
ncbi:MAG: redoxin domain-containing protein [Bacteroidota bacterium]